MEHALEYGDVTFLRCRDVAAAALADPALTARALPEPPVYP
ncbi:hypothetical protein [Amycolatopsis nalaikhensis]|uniref:Uncharacterized protein n=1 Tax=Amycolatopsis nalaikhensis TaxID=715472 RepID=A0ABY8XKV2_9PSEU|nr:hypothetical protein [Amycolatopsis sp. 2-2]WIV56265.1 hypothetical protein QP939_46985 [Amycolatopsis sp. 2-2]